MGSDASDVVARSTITPRDTVVWIEKAQRRIDPFRSAIAQTGGRSRQVVPRPVDRLADAAFGNFMLSWPIDTPETVVLRHLPDGAFFLRLLDVAYQPVFDRQPGLRMCVQDRSRLEMAFTNDVLQVQAAGPPGRYSMIRHHALVLHAAVHWLDEPARARWLHLVELLAQLATDGPRFRFTAEQLDEVEDAAFRDFGSLAETSTDPSSAEELLADPTRMRSIVDYQIAAGVAIGVLERDRLARGDVMPAWLTQQLSAATRDDYLTDLWRRYL